MEVYVARQPIFNKNMDIYGYELLYRRSNNNFYEGKDDSQATAEVINSSFYVLQLDELTNGTRAFINFSDHLILKDIPSLLPKEKVVIEILERAKITDKLIEACKSLKQKGYLIALDDFVFFKNLTPLIEIADIIKVEINSVPYENQRQLINKLGKRVKFLAEKVETREEFHIAQSLGYNLFQGYFFSTPIILKGNEIGSLNTNLVEMLNELTLEEPDYRKLTDIIHKDIELAYKLLRLANSVFFAATHKVNSVKLALVRLGTDEIKKWVYLMMLKEVQVVENKELVKISLIRGKMMELLSMELNLQQKKVDFFMTGLFSSIDILLNRNMAGILTQLPFPSDVKDALLGEDNTIKHTLNQVIYCEKSQWDKLDHHILNLVSNRNYMELYIESLRWVIDLGY